MRISDWSSDVCSSDLVAQVHRHPLVPISGRDFLDAVTVVIGRIVDQYVDAAKLFPHRGDHRLHGFDVPKVAGVEDRREIRALQPLRDRLALLLRDVAKGDPGALRGKGFNQAFADPAAAAADEDALALQARIAGAVHASRPRLARFAISAESQKLQGSASFDVLTRFTSMPRRGVEIGRAPV